VRILSWNCNNGINKTSQIDYFKSSGPDIAIIPELKKSNIGSLSPTSWVWVTNNHSNPTPKGLGVLAFNGFQLTELPRDGGILADRLGIRPGLTKFMVAPVF